MQIKKMAIAVASVSIAIALFFVLVYYYSHDPAEDGAPQCLFRRLTGFDCPGCGSQRALHALLHGEIGMAWRFNPFVFFAVPVIVFYTCAEAVRRRRPRLYAAAVNPFILGALLLAVLVFTVVRNL